MLCQAATSGLVGRHALRCHTRLACSHHVLSRQAVSSTAASGGSRRSALQGYTALGLGLGLWSMTRGAAAAATTTPAEQVLEAPTWPASWPFSREDFQRYDESPDTYFYDQPRFVTHIDDAAIAALTKYYAAVFPPSGKADVAMLDICSSWVSHYPSGYKAGSIVGLGMNEAELARNPALTSFVVRDLNKNPTLPFEDNTFDFVTNAVSVDYLSRPLEVFRETARVLKPGGTAIMSFSNRCFPTKAISMWTSSGDMQHISIVGAYFHYAGGYEAPQARDITEAPGGLLGKLLGGGRTDPMYVVFARKLPAA